jgi:hypothetical protein
MTRPTIDPGKELLEYLREQGQAMIDEGTPLLGAVLVAMDGNGVITMASWRLAPSAVTLVLENAAALNRSQVPSLERQFQQIVNDDEPQQH